MLKAAIGEIMSENVVKIKETAPIMHAAHILLRFQINGLLVTDKDGKKVIGVVTTTDFLRLLDQAFSATNKRGQKLEQVAQVKVGDVVSRDVISVQKDTRTEKVVALMRKKNIHTIPVYDGEKLVGVVGKHDLLNAAFYIDRM